MTKQQYLTRPIVNEFIQWISSKLDSNFTHFYVKSLESLNKWLLKRLFQYF